MPRIYSADIDAKIKIRNHNILKYIKFAEHYVLTLSEEKWEAIYILCKPVLYMLCEYSYEVIPDEPNDFDFLEFLKKYYNIRAIFLSFSGLLD